MDAMNKIEYIELENKIKQIDELSNAVENTFNKMDTLVNNNVNSGKGIWDGIEAGNFKNEWDELKEEIPKVINIFRTQAKNIANVIEFTTNK